MLDANNMPSDYSIPLPIILQTIVLGVGERRITVVKAAQLLRISRVALSNTLHGNADLSIELAARIEDVFRFSALALLQYQVARNLALYRERAYVTPLNLLVAPEQLWDVFKQGANTLVQDTKSPGGT